jgi:hypothetical protein
MSGSNDRYGRNAELLAEREAILALPPEQQGPALIAMSQRRSGLPSIPGGFREPGPESQGGAYTEGLPPATGLYADTTRGLPTQNLANSSKVGGVAEKRGEDDSTSTTPEGSRSTTARDALRGITGISPGQTSLLGGRLDLIDRDVALARRQGEIEQSQRRTIAQGEADASRGFAESQRRSAQELERRLQPIPEFVATRETARDIGALASLLMVAGAALGGKGKQGALMAVQSMTGMMAGYRQGRMDLYQRERQNFETGMRQVQAQNTQLQEAFTRAQRLAQTDLEAARQQFQVEAVRLGATLPNISAERAGLSQGQQILQQAGTALSQAEARKDAERTRVENATPIVTPGEQPGTFVYVRRDGTPILNPQGQPVQAPAPRGSTPGSNAVQFRYNAAIADAAASASTDIQNLLSMPGTATPPVLRSFITDENKGVTPQLTAFMGQRFTSTEQRATQQIMAGLTRAITSIQAAGRPGGVTQAALADFARTAPQPGDSRINFYLFLAMMKQEMDLAVTSIRNGGGTPEQLANAQAARDRVYATIPYSVTDITRIISSGRERVSNRRTNEILERSNRLGQAERQLRRTANTPEEAAANEADAVNTLRNPSASTTPTQPATPPAAAATAPPAASAAPAATTAAPTQLEVGATQTARDGKTYRFRGGNAQDRNNWEVVP